MMNFTSGISGRHSTLLQAGIAVGLILVSTLPVLGDTASGVPPSCPEDPTACHIARVTVIAIDPNGVPTSSHTFDISPVGVSITVTVQLSALLGNPSHFLVIGTSME